MSPTRPAREAASRARPQNTKGQRARECARSADLGGHVERSEHQDVDVAVNAGCTRQSGVGRDERARKALGERYVGGVVWGQVRAEFVGPDHQRAGREADDRERYKVDDGRSKPSSGEVTSAPASPKDGDCFYIDEIWRGPSRAGGDSISCGAPGGPVIADDVGQYGRVDDDQRGPRSSSRSATALSRPTRPPCRREMRASTSSIVGVDASRVSSVARYCWRDCPASSARRWRLAWTASGRSRTKTFGMLALCYQTGNDATQQLRPLRPDRTVMGGYSRR